MFVLSLYYRPPAARAEESGSHSLGYIDVHMHLVGSSGRGGGRGPGERRPSPGRRPPPGRPGPTADEGQGYMAAAENLVATMDRLGISKSVVMPPPQTPNQRGGYTYHEILQAIRRYPGRLVLGAGGGELNPIIAGTEASGVTAAIRTDFEKKAEEIVRAGARVFGEMAILHFSFSPKHIFKQIPADHPLYLLLADIAARHNIPIDLHWEAAPEDQETSEELRERSPNNPARISATVPGLERLLKHNRKANIVLVHVGWDNTGHQTIGLLRKLLSEHPNLFCGLKFVRKQYEPFQRGNKFADEDLNIRRDWVKLIADFPDRFVVGADEFVQSAGGSERRGPPSFEDTWSIIKQLPADLRAKVGRENAARIYGL